MYTSHMQTFLATALVLAALYAAWRYRLLQQHPIVSTKRAAAGTTTARVPIPNKEVTLYGTVGTSGKITDPLHAKHHDIVPDRAPAPSSVAFEF